MSNAVATVAFLQGQAWAKSPDGSLRPLSVGSVLNADEILVTAPGAKVELDTGDGELLSVQGGQEVAMSRDFNGETATSPDETLLSDASVQEALTVLQQGGDLTTDLEETAAGNTGGAGSEGHGFVQLARLIETTDPLAFSFDAANAGGRGIPDTDGEFPRNNPPEVIDQQLVFDEDTILNGQIIATDVENDSLTYTVLTQPLNGVLTLDPVSGAFTFTPNQNYNGADSFVVTVTDDAGNSVDNTITLTINAVNDAPVSSAQPVVTNEDTPVTGQVVATDVENDSLTFLVSTNPTNGLVSINAITGAYEYTPNPNFNGVDSFVVTVSDGNGGITTSVVSVTINPVNDAPVATNQTLTTAEDTAIDGQIVASDVDNDPLTYTVTTNPMNGSLLFNANGSFTYTPNPNYNGSDSFVVTVSDGFGGVTTSTISIGVTPVNDAPVAANRTVNIAEDTQDAPLNIAAPSDVDGDTLTITVAGLPSIGTVTLADGTTVINGQVLTAQELTSLRFDAPANVNSTETGLFQYSVSDGQEAVMGTITINVTPANDAPVANNLSVTTDEDTAYVGQIVATDIDGDTLSYSINTMPTNGTLTLDQVTGQFTYTPNLNYNGGDSFSVLVSDGRGGIVTSVVTVGVTPVNDAPVANPDLASTPINQAVTVDVRANDADVDNLRADLVVSNPQVDAAQGTATLDAQGRVVFTPALNFSGVATITYTLTDPAGLTSTGNLTVNVGANTAPTGADNVITLNEDGSHTFAANNFGFADADAAQTFNAVRIDTLPAAGSLTLGGVAVTAGQIIPVAALATLVFTPAPDANGNNYANFTFSVQDSVGGFDLVPNTIQLNVTPVNDAPTLDNEIANQNATEDTAFNFQFAANSFSDVDVGDVITYSAQLVGGGALPAWLSFDSATRTFSGTPANGDVGTISVQVIATDIANATASDNFDIVIANVNDAPTVSNNIPDQNATEDSAFNFQFASNSFADVDAGTTLTYTAQLAGGGALPSWLSFDSATRTFSGTPANGDVGTVSIDVIASDGSATVTDSFDIVIGGVNDAPVNTVSAAITMNEDTTQAITGLSVNDVDAGSSSITVTLQITNGILNVSGGSAVIVGNGTNAVTLTGTQAEINSTLAATVNYVPTTNFNGTSTFTITTNDNGNSGVGGALSDVDTVTITVNPVDDVTQITPVSQDLNETNSILSVNGTVNAVDVDSPVGFVAQNNVAGSGGYGLFTLAVNGQWSYSTNNAQNQFAAGTTYTDTLTVTALDGTTSTITVNILGTNDAPGITGLVTTLNYAESTTATITRTIIDSTVVLTDIDSANFAGGNVTVTINNVVAAQDQLTVQNQGTAVNQISVSGTNVSYNFGAGAVLIGTISGGTLGAPLVISLNNNATPVAVDALVQRIAYGNSSQLPNTTPRSITLSVTDGDGTANGGTDTFTQNITINVASNNDAPVLGALGGTRTYTEGGAAVVLDTNATIADGELVALANFGGMTLTVGRRGGINTDDDFVGTGTLSLTGGNVVLNGVTVGSYNAAQLDAGQLLITFANGVTNAQATSVLRQIAYRNTSDAPPSSLIVDFVLNDGNTGAQGSGGARNSTTVGVTVNITGVNDAPVAQALTLNGTEETNLPISLTGSDVDGTVQSVQLVNLPSGAQGVLYLSDGVTAVTTAMNLTPAQASNLIFTPTNNFNGNVSFNFIVRDNLGLASAPAAVNISVAVVNDAPLNAVPAAITMNEDTTQAITGLSVNDVDAGSSSITVTLQITNGILNVSGGLAVIAGNGTSTVTLTGTQAEINSTLAATVNYVPSANFSGTSSLTITTNDNGNSGAGGALIDVDTVTITINPIDDGSVANQNVVTNEDVVLNGNLPTTDADGAVTYAVITNQATTNGTVSVAANGSYTYTPNANYSGSDSFVVNVTDAQGFTTPVTVNVTVNPIDDGSVANQNVVTNEDVVLNGNLPTTDADGAVTYAVITNQATTNGTVSVAANGSYTYTPNANYSGSDSFVVNVTDAQGFTTPVTVNVTVNPIDDGSVANQNVVTNEDVVLNGNLPTTDADGAVTYAVITNQATTNGTVSVAANGSYTYTPNANYSGSDSFVVNVTDAQGFTTPVTVNVTVNPIDDGSVANQNVVTNEDVVLNGNLPTTDADGAVTYAVITNQATTNGTVSVAANGSYTYTPNANYSGSDSFVVNVTDAQGFTTPVTVNVTVNPIDDGSVANQNVVTNEDVVLNGNLPTTDADGAVTYAVITNQATTNGTVSVAANGSYTYTPNANYSGSDSFVVNVTDAQGFTTPVTVNVTVNPIDDGSVANQNVVTNEDVVLNGNLPTTDADGAVTYAVITNQATTNGTVSVAANGSYTYTPNANYSGSDSFVVNVTDAQGFTTPVTVNVTVNPIDDGSVATQNVVTNEDVVLNGNLPTTDADGAVTYAVITNQATTNGTVSVAANGSYTYTPNANYSGSDSFVVNVTDAQGFTTPVTVNVTVNPIDDGSVANQNVVTNEDVVLNGNLPTTDADGAVTYAVITNQATTNGTVSVAANGSYTYTPNANYSGSDSFVVNVTDAQGFTTPVTVNVTVNPIDDGSVANQNVVTNEDVVLNGNLPTTDADGAVTYAVITNQATTNGTVSVAANGSYTYTPNANYSGSDSFVVNVTDAQGFTTPVTVNVTVNPIDDGSVANQNVVTNEDVVLNGNLPTTDADGAVTYAVITNQATTNGTVSVAANGSYTYTPNANYSGSDSFVVNVTDAQGFTTPVTVNVTVNPIDDGSVANQNVVTNEDVVLNGNLPTTDADGAVTYAVITNQATTNGTVSVAANGSYTYTPNANYSGSDSFVVNVTDAQGFTTPVTVNVTVNPIDDGSVANQNVVTNEDVVLNGNLPTTDADGAVTYAVITNQATTNGTVSVAANGSYTYTPNANYSGSDSFVVNVTDAQGFTTPVTVNVTVNPIDDGSVATQNVVTNEDVVLNGNLPTTDADGAVTYAVITNQATTNGTVSVAANGSYTYTPNANYSGSDSFVVNVTDAQGFVTPVTVNVTVNPIDDGAVANQNVVTNEDVVLNGNLPTTDADGAVTYAVITNQTTTNGTVSVAANGSYTYTPNANYSGSDSFVVNVTDAQGFVTPVTVNVTVNPIDDGAVANQNVVTNEDVVLNGNLPTTDADGAVTYAVITNQATTNGTVSVAANGSYTYTPNANYSGSDSFTVNVTDAQGFTTPATVNVTVNPINDAPITTTANLLVNEEAQNVSLGIVAPTDVDSASLTITVSGLPNIGVVTLANGTAITVGQSLTIAELTSLQYDAPMEVLTTTNTSFTYTVSDGVAPAITGVANITVNPVNDAPIANDDPEPSLATTPVGLLSEYFGYQEGVDGGNLSNLAQVTTFINGRTPDATFTATEFRYGLDDLFGNNLGNGTNLQLFLGADAASLSADPGTTTDAVIRMRGYVELDAGTYNFRVRGDDGYQIKIDGVVVAQVNAIQPPTGTVHTTFTVAESGFHQIEVLYWDQGGQAVFQAEISNNSGSTYQFLSQIPTVSTGVFNLQEDNVLTITPSSLLANDSDIDGDVLSVLSVGNATHGTVSINGSGDIIFTPQLNYSGPASFEYTVSDGNGGTDVAKVAIYISPVNDAPTATGESFSTNEDAALTLTPSQLLTNDSDIEGDVLTISSVQGAVNGTVALVGSNVVFTPTANYNGPASFTYTVSDGNGGSSTATVNVTVNSVNDAPSGINQSVSLVEDKAYTFTLSDFSFSDVDNNSLNAVRITAVPGTGTVFLNNVAITSGTTVAVADIVAGRLVYLPSLNSNLSRTMTFQVQDDGGTANGGVNLDQSANVLTLNITADANDINAGGTSTTQTLALNVGNISINDNGGAADLINITSTGAPSFSAFNFERFGNNLEYQATSGANNTHVTVINEYVAGNKIEAISFTGGGDYSSYSLGTAAYSINTTATGIADVQEILAGSSIDDTLTGGGGTSSDMLFGGAGNDTLTTTGSGTHLLVGGSGNDTLTGGTGADVLLGGSGNDSLTGGAGVDVFVWKLADKGIAGSPATDTVADFTESATDKLNISDLLQGENSGNLTNYLHFTYDSGTNATTVHISSSGGYSSGFSNSLTDQTIVLSNYNPGSTSDATIISNLIAANKLITD